MCEAHPLTHENSHARFFARDWEEPSEVLVSHVYGQKFTLMVFRAMCAAI